MKNILVILCILISVSVFGQTHSTVLKYSQNYYSGTARFHSMGGAFTALGGDFGSFSLNPAGVGVYKKSEFVFSPGMVHNKINSTYLGNKTSDDIYDLSVFNVGYTAAYELEATATRWVNFNIGIGYNRNQVFDQNVYLNAVNNDNSLMDYFVNNANYGILNEDYEWVAWDAYMLLLNEANGIYYSLPTEAIDNLGSDYSQLQIRHMENKGSTGEFIFSMGGNYADKLYIGATVGITHLRFEEWVSHYEEDMSDYTNNPTVDDSYHSLEFIETAKTTGTGVNFKVGAIYKVNDFWRIGGAIHTPSFYKLDEEFYTDMYSYFDDSTHEGYSPIYDYDYSLSTPWRFLLGTAFQFGKVGLLSIDYEYVDYGKIKIGDRPSFNQDLAELYQGTHNIRAGGEVRVGSLYLHGGYAYYSSPFASSPGKEKSFTQIISGGLGYRVNNLFIDFAYSRFLFEEHISLYLDNPDPAINVTNKDRFIFSIGFRF